MRVPGFRENLSTGIVHFGPGAFHRAHQADYINRLLSSDPRWGIAAVSLRSRGTVDGLRRQNGMYTLAILDRETQFRTIRAHTRFLGPQDLATVRGQILDPAVRIVSSTVTEKGYCLAGDGTLDFEHPDILHDLARPLEPVSIIGWLALGLADRRSAALAPFVTLCCDNMVSNGKKLQAAVISFASAINPDLATWIATEAIFPDTMVDSITPATDDRLRRLVKERTGQADEMPVARESYSKWVIEKVLPADLPDFAAVGVDLTPSVSAWEKAKLRILNGAHSSLAYIGLLLGHEFVDEAMADASLSRFIERLVARDIIPSLEPSPLNLGAYAQETLHRFRNPAIHHRLSQIAWDGSQKLPYRLIATIGDALAARRSVAQLAVPIAAWILFLERETRTKAAIVDPLAPKLQAAATGSDPVSAVLALREIFPAAVAEHPHFRAALARAVDRMRNRGPLEAITEEAADA